MRHRSIALLVLLLCLSAAQAADVCLVREGKPLARIVYATDASSQLKSVAKKLAAYVKEATGAELPVADESAVPVDAAGPLVLLGQTTRRHVAFAQGFDDDGFIIEARADAVSICGPTDWGTEFGVYDFLERYVGVRWLLPGESGTDVPAQPTIVLPEGRVEDQPVFFSRLFSGLRGGQQAEWARCNRMHGRVSFHHSLGASVFPPAKFTATHPEFFPMWDGKTRHLPADGHPDGWQPCFSAPGSVEAAVAVICEYFRANPQEPSFSLGVNDSSGHCKCPACLARIPDKPNFLGLRDYSDLYYDWCNQVIAGVLKQYPDKWFGCLAYSEVAAPPRKVKVHPRLIPYMTYDRMKWVDPEVATAGHEATEAWHAASPTLGWYDYIYGSPYCLPRVWFHHAAGYLRYAQQQGVKAHYAEIYPNWGEGPKPYLHMKLWWNPHQDVDTLLNEWYVRCVGAKAAPDLAAYYAIWERFWTKDVLTSRWFSKSGQYLNFGSPAYLADVKHEDISASRRLLDSCLAKCETPRQRARAALLEQAFQYYEASALAYLANSATPPTLTTEADALAALDTAGVALEMARKRQHLALDVFPKDPVLVHPLQLEPPGTLTGGAGLWAVMDFVMQGDNPVRRKVQQLAQSSFPLAAQQAGFMLAVAEGKTQLLTTNASFEEGTKPWSFWVSAEATGGPAVGKMVLSQERASSGKTSVLCDHMLRGGPVYTVPFPGPGKYVALARVFVPGGQEAARGTVELTIIPRDSDNVNILTYGTKIVPPAGQWKLIVVGADIPAELNKKAVKSLFLIPIVDSFQGGNVYLDDVSLHRLP